MAEKETSIKDENEAIGVIKNNMPTSGYYMLKEALEMAIEALEEIQKYREIGTVEECLEAVKKMVKEKEHPKCKDCLLLEDRDVGVKGAVSGLCKVKPYLGRIYAKNRACRLFEMDH